jgi:hypothetical protein
VNLVEAASIRLTLSLLSDIDGKSDATALGWRWGGESADRFVDLFELTLCFEVQGHERALEGGGFESRVIAAGVTPSAND